jgi:hypothetical protein
LPQRPDPALNLYSSVKQEIEAEAPSHQSGYDRTSFDLCKKLADLQQCTGAFAEDARRATLQVIKHAFEAAGVEFIDENGKAIWRRGRTPRRLSHAIL